MGTCHSAPVLSSPVESNNNPEYKAKQARRNNTHARITKVLDKSKGDTDKFGNPITFERILLKFDRQKHILDSIKDIYSSEAKGSSGLNMTGLQNALKRLHTPLPKKDITDVFEVVDLDDSDCIELKEFLVALTVAHALDMIHVQPDEQVQQGQENIATVSCEDVKAVCNLILSAYLLFDPTGLGYITRAAVDKMIKDGKTKGQKENSNLMLNENRWKEMDWDSNGQIDFTEFVQAFSGWVSNEDED